MSGEKVSISIVLPVEKFKELAEMSLKTGVLKSNLVRNWIYDALQKDKPA